jgi:hypothetical protein
MKKFKDTLSTGTYIGVDFTNETNDTIFDLCSNIKVNETAKIHQRSDYHTTLIYDKSSAYIPVKRKLSGKKLIISNLNLELFKDYLVITFDSEELTKRHNELRKTYGFKYDYPVYRPHISIADNVTSFSKISLPKTLEIQISQEYSEPIKEDS